MKFQLLFFSLYFYNYINLVKTHELPDLIDTTPELFPFHAVIHARMVCGGILIANNYVITSAYCVYGSSSVKIYLGFRGYPYYVSHHSEPNTQVYDSSDIFIHEDFARIRDHYLNNIALIKLPSPATINSGVHPGKLISRQETQLIEGKFANVSGWLVSKDEDIKFATVQIRNQDTCSYLFGNDFLKSQELCVHWFTKNRLNLLGNAVQVDDKIIGFQTNTPQCVIASSSCTRNDMVLNFIPFLDWISHKIHIPVEQFTSKTQHCSDNENILAKIEHLANKIDETISNEKLIFQKYDLQVTTLNEKVENTIAELRIIKNEQNNFVISLNEQIGALKTEINNSRIQHDQNMLKLQEEINGARTELSNGLSAQMSVADLESKFEALNNTIQTKVDERLNKLEDQFKDLSNKTETNRIEEYMHFLELKQEITNLREKITEFDIKEEQRRYVVDNKFEYINATIIDMSSTLNKLNNRIEDVLSEIKIDLLKGNTTLFELQEKLNDVINTAHKNIAHGNFRFDEIERIFGEQRNDMDKHVIQEHREIHSLWGEIKSLKATLIEIKEFIGAEPGPN